MVRHIVMFWLRDRSPDSIAAAVEKLRSLEGKIPGMVSCEVGADFLNSERSCDLALNTLFESREALAAYRNHPNHLPVQAYMHGVREKSCAADYDV